MEGRISSKLVLAGEVTGPLLEYVHVMDFDTKSSADSEPKIHVLFIWLGNPSRNSHSRTSRVAESKNMVKSASTFYSASLKSTCKGFLDLDSLLDF